MIELQRSGERCRPAGRLAGGFTPLGKRAPRPIYLEILLPTIIWKPENQNPFVLAEKPQISPTTKHLRMKFTLSMLLSVKQKLPTARDKRKDTWIS
jgi:hypothetical protein